MADENEEKSMGDALRDAWDTTTEEGGVEFDDETVFSEDETESGSAPDAEPEIRAETAATPEVEPEFRSERDTESTEQVASSIKPPVSWTPTARESWDKLPAQVQQEVTKRERDFELRIQEQANEARGFHEFQQVTSPYTQFFAAEGVTATQATANLMQTAAGLRVGTPTQKAAIVRSIISNFGIDLSMLDNMLSGQAVANTGQDNTLTQHTAQAMLQNELAPIQNFMQNFQAKQQQFEYTTQANANVQIESFANDGQHEFFPDLRMAMADVSDYYAENFNQDLTLQEAYDKAGQLHPEIGPIMAQRTQAQGGAISQSKRNAASSIAGSPGRGGAVNTEDLSLRETLDAAWSGNLD